MIKLCYITRFGFNHPVPQSGTPLLGKEGSFFALLNFEKLEDYQYKNTQKLLLFLREGGLIGWWMSLVY